MHRGYFLRNMHGKCGEFPRNSFLNTMFFFPNC